MSVRRDAQVGFAEVRRRCEQEPELLQHGPAYVLYALMDNVVDRYFPVLDALTAEIEEIEERIFAGQTTRAQIEALYSLKRKLMTLDHATQPLLEVAGKLHGGRVPPICAGLHDYFRDVYDHLLRLKQSIDNLRDMVTTAISVNLSLITIQENEVTKRLAAYAALVAVPTMVAGVYGMNFANMPELQWRFGYPAAVAVDGADRPVSRVSLQEGEMDVIPVREPRDALCFASARELAGQIRARQVSAREVMTAFLAQINRLNPHLNAIVAKLDDEACLALADAADRALARGGRVGPLHGLPTAFKDLESAIGFPFTQGSPIYKDVIADRGHRARRAHPARRRDPDRQDQRARVRHGLAHLQQRLRHDAQSVRSHARPRADRAAARAPRWPPACCRSPMAAISAARCAIPANFNNIVALRPSVGLVPNAPVPIPFVGVSVKGPMARSVSDVAFLLSIVAGADARDPLSFASHPQTFAGPLERDLRGARVAWCPRSRRPAARSPRARVLDAQRQTFEDLGCIVEDACPDFGNVDEIFLTLRTWASWNIYGPLLARASRADEARRDLGHRGRRAR